MVLSIRKNFAYQMAYEVLALLLPLITSPYIARVIGAEGLGQYAYSYSIAFYFVLFSMLGLLNYGNRAVARCREDPEQLSMTFSNILADHILLSMLCSGLYVLYVLSQSTDRIYAAIQLLYVLSGLFDISWFYFGIEKFKLTVAQSSVVKLATVICIFVFVRSADDLWKYCLIMASGTLAGQLFLWLPLGRYVRLVKPSLREMRTHVKPLLILFIPAVAISLYKYMDKIMIGAMSNKVQLGLYENAEKIINVPLSVIGAFGTVMLPRMSNLAAKGDRQGSDRYILLSMRYVMCLAFALAFGIAGVARVFAPVFWGDAFVGTGPLIMGLAVTIPFISFANVIRTQYLIPQARDLDYTISVIAGAVINLIVNWLLIPRWGAMGATVGTIAAEMLVCIVQTISVRKQLSVRIYCKNAAPFLLLGASMFAVVYWAGRLLGVSVKTLIVQLFVGAVIYMAASSLYLWLIRDGTFMSVVKRLGKGN